MKYQQIVLKCDLCSTEETFMNLSVAADAVGNTWITMSLRQVGSATDHDSNRQLDLCPACWTKLGTVMRDLGGQNES